MATLKLFLRDGGTGLHYRFNGKSGREYVFARDPETNLKVLRIPLADWRANNFLMARDLLEQQLAHTIFPDFEFEGDAETEALRARVAELEVELTNALALIPSDDFPGDPQIVIEPTPPLTDEELAERLGETPEPSEPTPEEPAAEPVVADPAPAVVDEPPVPTEPAEDLSLPADPLPPEPAPVTDESTPEVEEPAYAPEPEPAAEPPKPVLRRSRRAKSEPAAE